jgi:hypothetical protein
MVSDPQNVTGRSKPAQSPVAPAAMAVLPEDVFAGPQLTPAAPSSATAPMMLATRELVPSTSAAPSPPSPADGGAEAPAEPSPRSSVMASAPAIGGPAPRPLLTASSAGAAPTDEHAIRNDEERTLLALLRLIDRVAGPGTLSPVERAFVSGAKIMFDQLSKECREMLKRKPEDLTRMMAPPGMTPHSVGNVPLAEATPAESETTTTAKRAKKAKTEQA